MFSQIASEQAAMPDFVSSAAKNLLQGLLKKEPTKRLGFANGFAEVKRHAFFNDIDWHSLALQASPGPLRPSLSGFYFDPEFVEELSTA